MREIKSRFWDKVNKRWEVFHIEIEVDPSNGRGDAKLFHVPPDHGIGILPAPDFDPASRGEFTGLTDRNGKEIYEGDIVSKGGRAYRYEVLYGEDRFILERKIHEPDAGYEWRMDLLDMCTSDNPVVIGNVYENPKLL